MVIQPVNRRQDSPIAAVTRIATWYGPATITARPRAAASPMPMANPANGHTNLQHSDHLRNHATGFCHHCKHLVRERLGGNQHHGKYFRRYFRRRTERVVRGELCYRDRNRGRGSRRTPGGAHPKPVKIQVPVQVAESDGVTP